MKNEIVEGTPNIKQTKKRIKYKRNLSFDAKRELKTNYLHYCFFIPFHFPAFCFAQQKEKNMHFLC